MRSSFYANVTNYNHLNYLLASLFYFYKHNFSYITNNTVNKNKIGIIAVNIDSFDNIYIRLFILHEPYNLL